jgi:hypothetical protein
MWKTVGILIICATLLLLNALPVSAVVASDDAGISALGPFPMPDTKKPGLALGPFPMPDTKKPGLALGPFPMPDTKKPGITA